MEEALHDESTILRFRHLLVQHELATDMLRWSTTSCRRGIHRCARAQHQALGAFFFKMSRLRRDPAQLALHALDLRCRLAVKRLVGPHVEHAVVLLADTTR